MYNPVTGKVELQERNTKKPETYDYGERLSFIGELESYSKGIFRHFIVHYYPYDKSVEIYDKDLDRSFLKRLKTNIQFNELYLGNKLRIYGRQIKLSDFANTFTKTNIWEMRTLCILKPVLKSHSYGPIITVLEHQDLRISRMTRCHINRKDSLRFYEYLRGRAICPFMVEHLVAGPSLGLELVGHDAFSRLYAILGPRTPAEGRRVAPHTLRAIYGHTRVINAIHGSVRADLVEKELGIFFPSHGTPPKTTALYKNTTLCIIKPHIIKSRQLGEIISFITKSHFRISALDAFHMSVRNTDEFLSRYKGLIHDFKKLQESFMEGPTVACEISGRVPDMDVFGEFQEFCGPRNPIVARQIRPNCLRAKFGVDEYRNACHCSTVREDAGYEVEFFFKILRSTD